MPDDLRDRIADLRRLRDAASPLPWFYNGYAAILSDPNERTYDDGGDDAPLPPCVAYLPKRGRGDEPTRQGSTDGHYIADACNLAPALADAYDAALATIAERDAEIGRLREALKPFAEHSRTRRASTVTDGDLQRAADALKGENRDG